MKREQADIEKIMKNLDVSEAEAKEILAYDKAVDRGTATDYDFTPDELKVSKKMRATGTRKTPTVYKLENGKQRKTNPAKEAIIAELATFLTEKSENECKNVNITNKTRQVAFEIGDKSYEITLVEKRKKA